MDWTDLVARAESHLCHRPVALCNARQQRQHAREVADTVREARAAGNPATADGVKAHRLSNSGSSGGSTKGGDATGAGKGRPKRHTKTDDGGGGAVE